MIFHLLMHTGKYEKLRFTNICRVCEAAGWATKCPGPRSSPTTAEWRVMRILYPSVSRHSPSSPPTFFILFSHHTNSYGHKMERGSEQSKIRHSQVWLFWIYPRPLLMIDNHGEIIPSFCHCFSLYHLSHLKPACPPLQPLSLDPLASWQSPC